MLRAVLLFVVGLLVGACTQAAVVPVPTNMSVETLESETIALIRLQDDKAKAFCSGVWVSETTILTAAHCIADEEDLFAYATKGDVFASGMLAAKKDVTPRGAKLYELDTAHDLALLRALAPVPVHGIARVRLDGIAPGARVSTMGHPLGLWWSYSSGDISALRILPGANLIYIQTTAPTSPGNSGCGLFDDQGYLVGVAHAGFPKGSNLALYIHGFYVDNLLKAQGANL